MTRTANSFVRRALPVVMFVAAAATAAAGPVPEASKFDQVAKERSRQLTGRSRVIVQFKGNPDARVITGNGGVPGRQLAAVGAQVAHLDNHALNDVASHPAVS